MSISQPKINVFIAFSNEDNEVVEKHLIRKLNHFGFSIKSELSLSLSDNLIDKIKNNINNSSFGFVLISKNFLNMNWKKSELEFLTSLEETQGKLGLIIYDAPEELINNYYLNISNIETLKINHIEDIGKFRKNEIIEFIIEIYKNLHYENEPIFNLVPEIEDVPKDLLLELKNRINIIIFTAVDIEQLTVLKRMQPLEDKLNILRGYIGPEAYFIGRFGVYDVVLTMCEPGSSTRDGIILSSYEAFSFWEPKFAILCGIAFGVNEEAQKIGDVLISKTIINYEIERIGSRIISRSPKAECSSLLLSRFRSAIDWKFKVAENLFSDAHFGLILSGEKLIDNLEFRNEQVQKYPEAIGGEMEGGGFYASSSRKGVEWIIIKGICDWASGKNDKFHVLAAEASVSLIYHILSKANTFEDLN